MGLFVADRIGHLSGATITQIRVDHAFTLLLAPQDAGSPASLLRANGAFTCRDAAGESHDYVDDYARGTLGAAIELLFNQEIRAASASPSGELILEFKSGGAMDVATHPHYEGWELSTPGMPTLVSPPGGGMPVWPVAEYGAAGDAAPPA